MKLTQKQKNILIAEDQGWFVVMPPAEDGIEAYALRAPNSSVLYPWNSTKEECFDGGPNYFEDLNATHEAERSLSDEERLSFRSALAQSARDKGNGRLTEIVHATAAERAESLGLTRKLWEKDQ